MSHPPGLPPLKVLFIGGMGRSGSTLLDRVLGRVSGFVSVGEIANIWRVGLIEDHRCGCGSPFAACPFWNEVLRAACPPPAGLDFGRVEALRRRVQEGAAKPRLLFPPFGTAFRRDLADYGGTVAALLRAAALVSGARVVVDSSKQPSHGFVLASLPGIELHVLQLVRDSRAVAYSWQRARRSRAVGSRDDDLPRLSAWRSVLRFYSGNLPLHLLRRRRLGSFSLLRYEDFVADPGVALRAVLQAVGEEHAGLPFLRGHTAHLGRCHVAAGNPMRHLRGEVEIHEDGEWRHAMPLAQQVLVRLGTLPLRLLYGYEGRPRR